MKTRSMGIAIILLMMSCVDPFQIESGSNGGMLVVEGVFSDQLKQHQILLSRATGLAEKTTAAESNAIVSIVDENNNVISLTEDKPGIYVTPIVAAQPGMRYHLQIKTENGSTYQSSDILFKDGPDIGNVYAKYIDNPNGNGKGLQVFVDTEDPSGQTRRYRWNYIETYEVHAPFPSNWIWVGNNSVVYRYEGIDTCYVTDTLRNIVIKNTNNLAEDKVTALPLRYIPDYSYIFRYRYSILVQQFALSEEAYQYWQNLKTTSEQQGTLSDVQPGSLPGNVASLADPDEIVLGYFDVAKVSEKRIFFSAIDFYYDGLKMPPNMRSNCYDIAPILVPELELDATMPRYERTMYIWEVYGNSPYATFELMPKSCCDCRDMGPTERPSFF